MNVKLQDTWVYQEAVKEGRKEQARSLIPRQLKRRFGELNDELQIQIQA